MSPIVGVHHHKDEMCPCSRRESVAAECEFGDRGSSQSDPSDKAVQRPSKRMLVQVVVHLVPHYRVPFYRNVQSRGRFELKVTSCLSFPGEPSLKSAEPPDDFVDLSHRCSSFWGGRLFWQHGVRLDSRLGAGDVVVVGQIRFLNTIPLMVQAKLRRARVAWWGQGWSATSRPWRVAMRRYLMRFADVVVLYTDQEAQEFIRSGFEERRVFALNNTIDTSGIEEARKQWDDERLTAFRSERGIAGKKLLLFCGRLQSKARLELALDAVSILRESDSRWMLVVIGSGEEEAKLHKYAEKKGLQGAVRWLGAIYNADEQAPWFLSAQCFLYPGGVGLSLMNSFAFGLPVITHDDVRTQMPEIAALTDGENGRLFRAGDAASLACKIQELDSDPATRHRMSHNAIDTIAQRFNMTNMVDRFIAAMESAAAN